jgi:hypothetical protein
MQGSSKRGKVAPLHSPGTAIHGHLVGRIVRQGRFIGKFSSASMEHFHFEEGADCGLR